MWQTQIKQHVLIVLIQYSPTMHKELNYSYCSTNFNHHYWSVILRSSVSMRVCPSQRIDIKYNSLKSYLHVWALVCGPSCCIHWRVYRSLRRASFWKLGPLTVCDARALINPYSARRTLQPASAHISSDPEAHHKKSNCSITRVTKGKTNQYISVLKRNA